MNKEVTPGSGFVVMIATQAVMLVLALLLLHYCDIEPRLASAQPARDLLLALAGAALTFFWAWGTLRLGERFELGFLQTIRQDGLKLRPVFEQMSGVQIGLVSLAAGVCEELLFRGFLQVWWAGYVGLWPAMVLASLVFGLVHFASWVYFIAATVIGLILGTVYLVTDSLLLVMAWHALYDIAAIWVIARRFDWMYGVKPDSSG